MRARLACLTLAAALGAALAAPASHAALFGDDEKLEQLRRDIQANEKALEDRIAKLESSAANRNAILDLAGQLDQLRSDLANLRGQVEVLANQIDTAEKRQKDLYLDIDTRLRKLEQPREAGAPDKPAADASVTPGETRAYEAALNQFKLGNYLPAITAFQGFLTSYPTSPLAPSAQYWIGNAHYAMREYRSAIEAQQKVITSWPDHPKAPDAMLNIASSKDALGDRKGAQKTLEELIAKYPASPAAASAKQRLSQGTRR